MSTEPANEPVDLDTPPPATPARRWGDGTVALGDDEAF